MTKNATIIALTGKGGVGKTSISASIVKVLVEAHPNAKILAIDADPAIGLSTALGIMPSITVDDIRKEIVERVEEGNKKEAIEIVGEARYRLFSALLEQDGFTFLAIGRPESKGCYCKVNAYLKEVISVLSQEFDYVVIDGEAGIEQINRRVMEKVTHLIAVTDPSKKGTQVIKTIKKVADDLVMYDKIGVVVNRLSDETFKQYIDVADIPLLAYIKDDSKLVSFDVQGKSVFNLPNDSNIVLGATELLKKLSII